jgi:demethylmenaquinone methyltransferase/2-methoxy-6-polyprenyl-1,4-benzoquinol methylase
MNNNSPASLASQAGQNYVNDVFHTVASRYDLMNDLMSFGMHRLWKDLFVSSLLPKGRMGLRILDVAGGTGDITARFLENAPDAQIALLDINASMLSQAYARFYGDSATSGRRPTLLQGSGDALPFEKNVWDIYSIVFGLRNIPDIKAALYEAYRVLDFGGRFGCLEFTSMDVPLLDRLYAAHAQWIVPALGQWAVGEESPYTYLTQSIEAFPKPHAIVSVMEDAGLRNISCRRLCGGLVAFYSGWKI